MLHAVISGKRWNLDSDRFDFVLTAVHVSDFPAAGRSNLLLVSKCKLQVASSLVIATSSVRVTATFRIMFYARRFTTKGGVNTEIRSY